MVRAIVGANWGDEGKGKLTDMLAEKSDIVVRFQGGANAGHTIVNHYGKFALHTLPSGVFYDHTTNIIGNGVALNIPVFFNELKKVTSEGVPKECRYVANVWCYHFLILHKSIEKLISVDRRLVIEMFKKNVLCFKNSLDLYLESLFVKQLLYQETYLCIFIRIERCDTRFC